jgi:hypothetical protein
MEATAACFETGKCAKLGIFGRLCVLLAKVLRAQTLDNHNKYNQYSYGKYGSKVSGTTH